jgi:hypothetical protein
MALTMSVAGQGRVASPPTTQPVVITRQSYRVGEPANDGDVPVWVQVIVEGDEPENESLSLSFRAWVDADGSVRRLDVASDLDGEARDSVIALTQELLSQRPIFPSQPVGVGATWTVRADLPMAGMVVASEQTFHITSISDEAVELDLMLSLSRPNGPIALPGLPSLPVMEIGRFEGLGRGTMRAHLNSLVVEQDVALELFIAAEADMGGAFAMEETHYQWVTVAVVDGNPP